jgi:hypothetical protein
MSRYDLKKKLRKTTLSTKNHRASKIKELFVSFYTIITFLIYILSLIPSSYPMLASLSLTSLNLNIANYWAVLNGSYTDFVGGATLSPQGGVVFVSDRLGNAQGSFQTTSGSYVTAPAGIYFPGSSFSITMWVSVPSTGGVSKTLFDFSNGAGADNIMFINNNVGVSCSYTTYVQITSANSGSSVCVPPPFTTGLWYHLAITYNISSLTGTVYLNGNSIATAGSQKVVFFFFFFWAYSRVLFWLGYFQLVRPKTSTVTHELENF